MKALLIIIILFELQVTSAIGNYSGDNLSVNTTDEAFCPECPSLMPVVPMEASYEDLKEVANLMVQEFLTPEIPMVADFSDSEIPITPNEMSLAPKVPVEADFQDTF